MVNTQPAEQRGLRYDSLFLLFPFRLTPPPGCAFLICYLRITTLPPWEDHVTGIRRVGGLHTQQTWKDISCSSWLTVLYWPPAAFAKSRSTTTTVALRIMTFFRAISAWVPWAAIPQTGRLMQQESISLSSGGWRLRPRCGWGCVCWGSVSGSQAVPPSHCVLGVPAWRGGRWRLFL